MKRRADSNQRHWTHLTAGMAAILALALLGCQPKTEAPPATEATPVPEAVASVQPITLTWNQQSNCVDFSNGRIEISVGDQLRFNSSINQTVTLRIAAGAFGAADTTMTIQSQGSYTTGAALTPGSYDMTSTPGMCPGLGGGVGPIVIIEESK